MFVLNNAEVDVALTDEAIVFALIGGGLRDAFFFAAARLNTKKWGTTALACPMPSKSRGRAA
jgi:hypothetical protein